MRKLTIFLFLTMILCIGQINAQILDGQIDDPGDIAFVGYHDSDDGFSFVFLDDCPAGMSIRFIDEEWNGTAFESAVNEGEVLWENNTGAVISKGTVVNITDADDNDAGIAASIGTAVEADPGFGTAAGLETEQLYAVTGTRSSPGVFLTFLGSTSNASLDNTDLQLGVNALQITAEGYYSGSTACNGSIEDCAAMLNNASNWTEGEFDYPAEVIIALGLTLSIDAKNAEEIQIKIYPNPVDNRLSLNVSKQMDNLVVCNTLGQPILTAENLANKELDVSILKPGTYYLKMSYQGFIRVIPFVKT